MTRQSPTNRILLLLKTEGPQATAALAAALGITGEAARQQLSRMAEDGLVTSVSEGAAGRGRPRQLWHLTAAGNAQFPDGHAALTTALLSTLVAQLGTGALEAVIAGREAETLARYRAQLADAPDLADRVRRLVAIRTAEGYMADSWMLDDGSWLLVENHCPICAAATACAGFCRSELETFHALLGGRVERAEHILQGARRCAYRITP
ncbi:metalloregulator ArsR/SmtB family transcription factor [Nitrospirillum sp. BR 11163]|uniref:helix-turn-helix transcriptional regulator n=1 Tax=Nitrospirillum sp. BR 11163 TaxID=3104323 RepID=UPI002AFFBC09|nr:metalloregulator ArsR/SmtB family transcription factor [Nitrospirillum sp. BR 11163]MEA1676361.1 metalloregulator ArsR/SmtB family transcription factor [Nitrospirillum sp. BR 11163]